MMHEEKMLCKKGMSYFCSYKMGCFSLKYMYNPKYLEPSYKTDLDFLGLF